MTHTDSKIYPSASPEAAKLLGLNGALPVENPNHSSVLAEKQVIADLPIQEEPVPQHGAEILNLEKKAEPEYEHAGEEVSEDLAQINRTRIPSYLKAALPFVFVFCVGLLLYYFFFTRFDISRFSVNLGLNKAKQVAQKVETPKESALDALKRQNEGEYLAWVRSYYFDVTDLNLIDPDTDNSGNGLTNFQKYILNLNPKAYDTLGLGMADTEALSAGINPLTGGKISQAQKDILEKYVDMEVAMNRFSLYSLNTSRGNLSTVNAGTLTSFNLQRGNVAGLNLRNDNTALSQGQNPEPVSDVIGLTGGLEINTEVPGRLEVPALNINVPIMWTKDPKNFDKDLQSGVVHYPGTALPGQVGTAYISGHSSNYVWAKGDFNRVFSKLGDLPDNTSFKITVVQKNGRDARLHFIVTKRAEYKPADQAQFQNASKPTVALSTCWPVGSTAKRLVVFGELTQVEKD